MRRAAIFPVLMVAAALSCGGMTPVSRPNVIIICIDALRRDYLGTYGHTGGVSPNIDALAREAVVFDHAVSVASWTKPSVVSLLTGLYPGQHRVLYKSSRQGSGRVEVLAPEIDTLAEFLKRAGYRTGAFLENEHLTARYSHLDQGFDTYIDHAGTAPVLTHRFLSWLERSPNAPLFAYLHILDTHWPYTADDTISGRPLSADDELRVAEWGLRGRHWRLLRERVNQGRLALDSADLATLKALYAAEIFATDAVLGRMLQLLRINGVLDRSLLVITSDHGEGFLEHGKLDHGYGPYDELVRVPLIVRFPRAKFGGRRILTQVQSVDLAPTVIDYIALPHPSRAGGRSLLAMVQGSSTEPDQAALSQEAYGRTVISALRTRTHKYIRTEREGAHARRARPEVPADLKPGVRVRAEGIFAGGMVVAAQVKRTAPEDFDNEIVGPIAAVDVGGNELRVIGYRVQATPSTRLLDGGETITLADLRSTQWVRAQGLVQDGTLRATKIERIWESSAEQIGLEGMIEAVGIADPTDPWLELCGSRVFIAADATWKNFGEERRLVGIGEQQQVAKAPKVLEELYDLRTDPGESRNIAADQPHILSQLRATLAELRGRLAPAVARTPQSVELDPATRDRLRALGYLK